jgi:hypothetical protein
MGGGYSLALNTKNTNFGRMYLQITQHKNNRLLLLSLANYFKSPNKIYYYDINSIQVTLSALNYEKLLYLIILASILYTGVK